MKRALWLAALAVVGSCAHDIEMPPGSGGAPSDDVLLRKLISQWGPAPILPMANQPPALVALGQALFFDKTLSGNRDVACATCHDMSASAADGLSLAIGTGAIGSGATRSLGAGRQFVPRNAPTILNTPIGLQYTLWDGRLNSLFGPSGSFQAPAGVVLPKGLTTLLAAQAMLPVLNRVEMRGAPGDTDVNGAANELASLGDTATGPVWSSVMKRLLAIQGYVAMFHAAYPGVADTALGFQHAANAIAAFEAQSFMFTKSPFDKYLANDNSALTPAQKRGATLFFGSASCASCHGGPFLGGQRFANIGVPQIGPGIDTAAPRDIGRANVQKGTPRYWFRVPPLRNVELTAPYMHDGAYPTLEAVLRHYTNPDSAQRHYDPTQLDARVRPLYHGDAATINDVLSNLDFQVRNGIPLTPANQADIVAFLKSLTDPAARDLSALRPVSVPSGLPLP